MIYEKVCFEEREKMEEAVKEEMIAKMTNLASESEHL
jgi:hypothetical protein